MHLPPVLELQRLAGNRATAQLLTATSNSATRNERPSPFTPRPTAPPHPARTPLAAPQGLLAAPGAGHPTGSRIAVQTGKLTGGETAPPGRADVLANALAHELVFTGLTKGDGKLPRRTGAKAAAKAQDGILTPQQAAQIEELESLEPGRLGKLGFLPPDKAATVAENLSPHDLLRYPPLQQMQLRWALREALPISQPQDGWEDGWIMDASTDPTSADIALKKGRNFLAKKLLRRGPKEIDDAPDAYRDLVASFVKRAGVDYVVVQENARLLQADFVAIEQASSRYLLLEEQLAALGDVWGLRPKEVKEAKKRISREKTDILRGVHEKDMQKAHFDAQQRAHRANLALSAVVRERALIEHFYDLVQTERNDLKLAKMAERAMRRAGTANEPDEGLAAGTKAKTAQLREWVQQAKASYDQVALKRAMTDTDKEYVQKKLDRLPGAKRKVAGKVVGGALGAAVSMGTVGFASAGVRTDERGYVKGGISSLPKLPGAAGSKLAGRPGKTPMPSKGFPIKFALLNDIRTRMSNFKSEWSLRGQAFIWDKVSAGLNLFNEVVLQNVINISGTVATWLTVVGVLLGLTGIATFGASSPFGVALTALGLTLGAGGVAAALVKALINGFRSTAGFVSALWNQDAKVQNQLNARVGQASIEALAAAGQAGSRAASLGMYGANVGGAFEGLSPLSELAVKGGKIAGTQALGLATGPVAGGVAAAGSKLNAAYDSPAPAPSSEGRNRKQQLGDKLRDEVAPGAGNRVGIAGPDPTRFQIPRDDDTPEWMKKEVAIENQHRQAALKSRTAVAKGEAQLISTKAKELKGRLESILSPLGTVVEKLPKRGANKVEGGKELGRVEEIFTQSVDATDVVASDLTPDVLDASSAQ